MQDNNYQVRVIHAPNFFCLSVCVRIRNMHGIQTTLYATNGFILTYIASYTFTSIHQTYGQL